MMMLILKHKDEELLKFEVLKNIEEPVLKILWKNNKKKNLLPLDLEVTEKGLAKWIKRRNIPKNRAFVDAFLSKQGLSSNRPMDIISVSKGLSLNDVYWVVEKDFKGKFKDYNLYDNKFNSVLALIAFTGYGNSQKSEFSSSPEFTTNGMLPKCWRRIAGNIYLYKGGTTGASNTGNEPTSEVLAYQVGKRAGFNVIKYDLKKWEKVGKSPCSACKLFTSKNISYIPVGRLVTSGGMTKIREYYKKLGKKFEDALDEMIVFDAIICNTDRHYGNFGFLIDNKTNKIFKPAPLFDHGNSLFNFAGLDTWDNEKEFNKYVLAQKPANYNDFIEEAKKYISKETKAKVKKLFNFKFTKSNKYSRNDRKLKMIENVIRERAREILD